MDKKQVYLGDGVYASFDGWVIWLAVNNPENIVVALEPDVLENLKLFFYILLIFLIIMF